MIGCNPPSHKDMTLHTTHRRIFLTLLATASLGFAAAAQKVEAFASNAVRESTQVLYFARTEDGFAMKGAVSIHYGAPDWKNSYAGMLEQPSQRYRLGKDGWTTLDTNVALKVGDTVIAPGTYYLALATSKDKKPQLVLLDADSIRPKKTMPNDSSKTTGGTSIPLQAIEPTDDEHVHKLRMQLTTDQDDVAKTRLTLRWGSLMLVADMVAQVDKPK